MQGCDASILLKDGGEREAAPNNNSVRGYEVIDDAKAQVEKLCPGVVSCADVLTVAARDASVAVGVPSWTVKLGRRDSTTGNPAQAVTDLPFFEADLETLITDFDRKGLSVRDMVALSGIRESSSQTLLKNILRFSSKFTYVKELVKSISIYYITSISIYYI